MANVDAFHPSSAFGGTLGETNIRIPSAGPPSNEIVSSPVSPKRIGTAILTCSMIAFFLTASSPAPAQQSASVANATSKPVIEEWVYRTKYGYQDEWWRIFKRYQVAILERQKQLGYVKEYTVYAPSLHTSEDSRWDYRVIIVRASQDAPAGQSEAEVARQLFPDRESFKRAENRRWELTANHWDLPIHVVKLDGAE